MEDPIDKIRRNQEKYSKSEKGKTAIQKYQQSGKGKEAREKYLKSEKGQMARLRYQLSEKGLKNKDRQNYKQKLAYRCIKWMEENPGSTAQDFYNLLQEGGIEV